MFSETLQAVCNGYVILKRFSQMLLFTKRDITTLNIFYCSKRQKDKI